MSGECNYCGGEHCEEGCTNHLCGNYARGIEEAAKALVSKSRLVGEGRYIHSCGSCGKTDEEDRDDEMRNEGFGVAYNRIRALLSSPEPKEPYTISPGLTTATVTCSCRSDSCAIPMANHV